METRVHGLNDERKFLHCLLHYVYLMQFNEPTLLRAVDDVRDVVQKYNDNWDCILRVDFFYVEVRVKIFISVWDVTQIAVIDREVHLKPLTGGLEELDCLLEVGALSSLPLVNGEGTVGLWTGVLLSSPQHPYFVLDSLGLGIDIEITKMESAIICKTTEDVEVPQFMNASCDPRYHDLLHMTHILAERVELEEF
jgi:hypothetical protein